MHGAFSSHMLFFSAEELDRIQESFGCLAACAEAFPENIIHGFIKNRKTLFREVRFKSFLTFLLILVYFLELLISARKRLLPFRPKQFLAV